MISLVSGTLNRLELLKQVIENTVNICDKLELVLVDGGSTDGTIEYIKSLDNKNITLIEYGKRSKVPEFINLGIKNAKFEIICQWNDDVVLTNTWDEVISKIDDSDLYLFSSGGVNTQKDNAWLKSDLLNFGLIKKDVYRKIGLLDEKFNFYCSDFDFTLRAISKGFKLKICNDIFVKDLTDIKLGKNYPADDVTLHHNMQLYSQCLLPDVEYLK